MPCVHITMSPWLCVALANQQTKGAIFLQNPQQRGTNLLRYNLRTPLEGKNDTWILQEPAQFHMKTRRFMKNPTLQRALSPAEVTFERLVHLQNFVTYSIHATTYPQAKAMRSFIAPMNCN